MTNEKISRQVNSDVPAIKNKLRELIRYASFTRFKMHTGCDNAEILELGFSFKPGRILANNMVFLLVSGSALRVTFKVHFNITDGKDLAFLVFGGNCPSDISSRQAIDYFKEYNNLVAGHIVTLFEKINIGLGMSLPLCTRGFYEVFSDYTEQDHPVITYSDFWELRVNDNTVYCSAMMEILDKKSLERLLDFEITEEVSADAEMDFL